MKQEKTYARAIVIALSVLASAGALATNGTWIANSNGNWSDGTKWDGGIIADGGGTADFRLFNLTADRTITVDSSRTIGILYVGSGGQFRALNILTGAGSTLTFDNALLGGGNAEIREFNNTLGDTIGGEIRLKSSLDLYGPPNGFSLHLTGNIASSATSGTQILSVQSGRADIAADIADGSTGGKIALLVNSDLTILGTNNTYTGGTTIASTLRLGSGGPGLGQVGLIPGDIALSTSSSTLEIRNGTFNTHLSNTISGPGRINITGVDSAHRALVTFDGSTNNTYTGGTTLLRADVFLNKSSGNAIDGKTTSSINAADVSLQDSTLNWQGDNQLGDGVVLNVQTDSQVRLNGHTEVMGGFISAARTSVSTGVGGNLTTTRGISFTGGGTLNFASEFIINANATVNLLNDPSGNGGNPSLIIRGAGSPSITFGALRVHGAAEDGGGTTGGVLQVGSGGMIMSAGVLLLGSDSTSPGKLNLFGNLGISGASVPSFIQSYGANGLAGYIDLGGAVRTLTMNGQVFGATDLQIDAPITNGGIIKNGIGNMTLSGASTYAGGTTLNGGTTKLSGAGTLGATAGGLTVNSAVLNLNGTSQMVGALNGAGGVIQNNASNTNSTLTVGSGGGSGAYDGLIRDTSLGFNNSTVALTKAGNGTETLTNANTYTGSTTINGGTLKIDNDSVATHGVISGTTSIAINSGGTLRLSGSSLVTNRVKDNAMMTLNGGTFNTGGLSERNLSGATITPGIGPLLVLGNSIVDLDDGASILAFVDSSTQIWTGILSIYNWSGTPITGNGTDELFFGTNATGLTLAQLSSVKFYSDSGSTFLGTAIFATDLDGEIVPLATAAVPDAGSTLNMLLIGGIPLLGASSYFRRRSWR